MMTMMMIESHLS